MKKLVAVSVLSFSLLSASALADTFKGVVSDTMCSKNPAKAASPDHAACAQSCIKGGDAPVLVVGTKIYKIANPAKLTAYAGKTVTVDGTLAADTITVNSVKP
jgi:hypothetical protein